MIAKVILLIFALACIVIEPSAGQQDVAKRSMFKKVHRWFIFEGTKWCGPNSIAKSYSDLGRHRETDKCCREHDKHCRARIKGFQKKYYLQNFSWKTSSHCDCEKRFSDCLLNIGNEASKQVYKIYFKTINPRCIRFKKSKECVKRRWICIKKKIVNKAYFVSLKNVIG